LLHGRVEWRIAKWSPQQEREADRCASILRPHSDAIPQIQAILASQLLFCFQFFVGNLPHVKNRVAHHQLAAATRKKSSTVARRFYALTVTRFPQIPAIQVS
jgi:hypothetical protein